MFTEKLFFFISDFIRRGAVNSLISRISYFPIFSTAKRIFLVWAKEGTTTNSYVCGAQGKYVE
jgi:hypothetical protein